MSFPIKRAVAYTLAVFVTAVLAIAYLVYDQLHDLENFKLALAEHLEGLTHRKVSIGSAELSFSRGIGVRLKDVTFRHPTLGRPEFASREIQMRVKFLPLLNKRVEIQKVIVHDSLTHVSRDAGGRFNFDDLRPLIASGETPEPGRSPASPLLGIFRESLLHKLELRNGEIRFLDFFGRPQGEPADIRIVKVDLFIQKNLVQPPFSFTLRGEIPNAERTANFEISGNLRSPSRGRNIQDLTADGTIKIRDLHLAQFQHYLPLKAGLADSWTALDSQFSGALDGRFSSSGKAVFASRRVESGPAFTDASTPSRGSVSYKLALDKDKLALEQLDFASEQFHMETSGSITRVAGGTPEISFSVRSGEFLVDKSGQYPPLTVFPEKAHELIHKIFKTGSIQINELSFKGAMEQFQNLTDPRNLSLLRADLSLNKLDWISPLPPFKKVSGSLKFGDGEMTMLIDKSHYQGLPVAKLAGKVGDLAGSPYLDWQLDSGVDLAQLHKALPKIVEDNSFEPLLKRYQGIQGAGTIRIGIKGPLEGDDNLAIDGALTLDKAEIKEKILTPVPISGLKGKVAFSHPVMQSKSKKPAPRPWLIDFEKLSGNFGKNSFSNLKMNLTATAGKTVLKTSGDLVLKPEDNPAQLLSHFLPEGEPYLRDASFSGGEVRVGFNSQGDPLSPPSLKQWGTVELRNLTLKLGGATQPLSGVSGSINYSGGNLKIKDFSGYLGKSSFKAEGEAREGDSAGPQWSVRAVSNGFYATDFRGVPFLEKLEYNGPAKIELAFNGPARNLRFENKIDLTRASYRYKDILVKESDVPNKFQAKGQRVDGKSIAFDQLTYELGGNKAVGRAFLKSFDDPAFTVSLSARDVKMDSLGPFLEPFKAEPKGVVRFDIGGKGDLRRFDASEFEGDAEFRDLTIQPDNFAKPLQLKGKVKFVNNQYELQNGELAAGDSHFQINGEYKSGKQPALNLNLRGQSLVLEDFLAGGGDLSSSLRSAAENSPLLSRGSSRATFHFDQVNYKFWRLKRASGELSLKDKELKLEKLAVVFSDGAPLRGSGTVSLADPRTLRFETGFQAKNARAEHIMGLFGHVFGDSLSGAVQTLEADVRGSGNNWNEIKKTLGGRIVFDLDSGKIDTQRLQRGVSELFDFSGKPSPEETAAAAYERIAGDFALRQGIAETERFLYVTEQRSVSLVGKFNLDRNVMDTVVGVAPLPALDKLLAKIPVVGRIITAGDEESLVKTYYSVTGPFDNPKTSAIPLTSLEKKVVGIFQGILQTPQEIFAPARDNDEKK